MGIQAGSLSEILNKMEKQGWIERTRNENDRRGIYIAIAKSGKEWLTSKEQERQKAQADLFGNLSEEEKEQLAALLEKLLLNWNEE